MTKPGNITVSSSEEHNGWLFFNQSEWSIVSNILTDPYNRADSYSEENKGKQDHSHKNQRSKDNKKGPKDKKERELDISSEETSSNIKIESIHVVQ